MKVTYKVAIIDRSMERLMWRRYWNLINPYNNVDKDGNMVGRGVVPEDEEDRLIYIECNRVMANDRFKNNKTHNKTGSLEFIKNIKVK